MLVKPQNSHTNGFGPKILKCGVICAFLPKTKLGYRYSHTLGCSNNRAGIARVMPRNADTG